MPHDHHPQPSLEELGLDQPARLTPTGKISIEELQRQSEREIESYRPAARRPRESTMVVDVVAALLSLLLPGAGQMLKGRVGRGLAWLLVTLAGYLLMVLPGIVLHLLCVGDVFLVGSEK